MSTLANETSNSHHNFPADIPPRLFREGVSDFGAHNRYIAEEDALRVVDDSAADNYALSTSDFGVWFVLKTQS